MAKIPSKWLALAGLLSLGASSLFAQDSKALIDLLIKKGVLTDAEAAKVTAEVAKANAGDDVMTNPADKFLKKLTLSGRIQIQFADLGTNINGAAVQPVSTEHFLMRRVYFGFKADFGNGWTGVINYDLANASFDLGYIEWKQSDALFVDTGFRRVPIGLEEWGTSSANLRAIERSPATRYFVESNNGRRLGAGAYRIGVFAGGADSGFTYNFAVTNSERDEFSSLNGNSDPGVQGSGTASNNTPSLWGNVGYGDKFPGGTYKVGASAGYLPDQGGPGSVVGQGNGITVYNLYGVWTMGGFDLEGEYFWADDHRGASATTNARPSAYWIQPAYRVGDWEAVVRYSYVDSDGRGVNISDGTRSAPSGGTMNKMSEWFIGGNWYIKSNDVKLQLGYIHSESKDTVTGGSASAKADGVRSQMQVSF